MFRRKRSSSHQPLSTPSQSAQSAASHAFLKSQPSSTSLSSAAAATALRSLTPTPQPVENVQTKRMLQRHASITSQPNLNATLGHSSPPPQNLRRASSSSSMSSRTFRREQSPRRPLSSSKSGSFNDAPPPLPAMPPGYTLRKQASGRSLSMGPPARLSSPPPPPRQQGRHARGMSVDRGVKRSPPRQSPGLGTVPELESSASRNSINFSYPMNARPNSSTPPPSPPNPQQRPASVSLAQQVSPEPPRAPRGAGAAAAAAATGGK